MNQTENDILRQRIEHHPQFKPTFERWLSVCRAAGRNRQTAKERAYGHAFTVVARLIEREDRQRDETQAGAAGEAGTRQGV